MLTTQIQVLLYVGNIQLVSCSIFVPIPAIVVKSHQTLEAILPYLPLSLTAAPDPKDQQLQPTRQLLAAPPPSSSSSSDSHALVRSPSSTSLVPSRKPSETSLSLNSRRPRESSNGNHQTGSGNSTSSNRISPDSSIPATTCIKISLHPTPTFKFVKPKCPHLHQKNRNQRHLRQQQQQQQQQQQSSHPHSHPHSNSHSHSHSDSSHSHSHSHSRSHRHSSMPSLQYHQSTSSSSPPGTVVVTLSYPFPSDTNGSTSIPEIVQVTGTFNAWQRTEPLVRNPETSRFEGEVPIVLDNIIDQDQGQNENKTRKKILFKFVLDGSSWVTDPEQESERDQAGNLNNVLYIDIGSHAAAGSAPPAELPEVQQVEETPRSTKKRVESVEEDDEATIRRLGGGMWGTPYFAVNDSVDLPEHFTTVAEQDEDPETEAHSETLVSDTSLVVESTPEPRKDSKADMEVEDEDDRVIRELGGGMWGTPFFQVNDSVTLPEHFAEAIGAPVVSSTDDELTTAVADKDIPVPSNGDIFEGEPLKDEISAAAEGSLIETVETEDPSSSAETPALAVETASTPAADMLISEIETTTAIQGDDGVEAVDVVEDTIIFMEGSLVDSESLHSLTTAIKPVQSGESFIVEQSPEVVVVPPVTTAPSEVLVAEDAKPVMDESVDPVPSLTNSHANSATSGTVPSSLNESMVSLAGDEHDGIILLQGQPILKGDAKPTADLSAATLATPASTKGFNAVPTSPKVASPRTAAVSKQTKDKSEKRKSIWKKIKQVLA